MTYVRTVLTPTHGLHARISVNVSPGSAPKRTPRRSLSNMPKELMGGL
jgi:hypothetical protein